MISIVIPALNEEEYLPHCLSSLMKQDWDGAYEIIVVDNGSIDNTRKVAQSYGVRVTSCSRRGVTYARQTGADAAIGDIIAQADADTVYPPQWLARMHRYFETHNGSAGLAGRYVYSDPAWWAPVEQAFRRSLNTLGFCFFRWPASVSGANFAFRRSAFIGARGYDPDSLYPDQWGIARRLSRFGPVTYDHASVVTTSSRRVVKPAHVIAFEIMRNCCHVAAHFLRHCTRRIAKPEGNPETT